LEDFAKFLCESGISSYEEIEREDIEDYLFRCKDLELQAATLARRMVCLKVFFGYLFQEKLIPVNIMDVMDAPKIWRTLPDSLTEEEMRAEAESAFRRAEELLANYQAAPENIRNAILRYGNAMKYYEQFEPKPREWDICRKQLEKANKIYKNIYEGLVFNIQRYNKLRQFDKASGECQKMLELVDPDSPDFRKYKAYKVAFDKQLRRKK
jgi:tetratricopeptide (TPR) repeat protein